MVNKEGPLDIYLMGIGGTAMGAFAGLLKEKGHRVFGSDNAVYSPMKEKLDDWGIKYRTPYSSNNLPSSCDLVIVGNVIRRDNIEAVTMLERQLPFDSFPAALNKLFFKNAIPIVASGTHGKTTCSALLAHTLFEAKADPGFLIGGIPCNFNESFRLSKKMNYPFVIEGDEYDTAYFDKRPKFIHYDPKFLLVTSLEFDHGDIYKNVDAIIEAFVSLMKNLKPDDVMVVNNHDENIKKAIAKSACPAKIFSYGPQGNYQAVDVGFDKKGMVWSPKFNHENLGLLSVPLFGEHNLMNALGCYAILHQFGLTHDEIKLGFKNFLGVKRRLEERISKNDIVIVDDFAHHPTAVKETVKAAKQKYPGQRICAIFEPRSATSCMKIFEEDYQKAFLSTDEVFFAPMGRSLPKSESINTEKIAKQLMKQGIKAQAFFNYKDLRAAIMTVPPGSVLLFMSNGDFQGMLSDIINQN